MNDQYQQQQTTDSPSIQSISLSTDATTITPVPITSTLSPDLTTFEQQSFSAQATTFDSFARFTEHQFNIDQTQLIIGLILASIIIVNVLLILLAWRYYSDSITRYSNDRKIEKETVQVESIGRSKDD